MWLMKTFLSFLLLLFIAPVLALEGWETDFEAAKKKAKEHGKDIFIVYKRPDWDPAAYGRTERLLANNS